MALLTDDLDLKFPFGEHEDCRALTNLTLESLPADGSLGKTRRYARAAAIWRPEDRSDKLFFVRSGRVVISSIDRAGREFVVRSVEAGEFFGEMCFCDSPATRIRHTIAQAVVESVIIEIKLIDFIEFMRRDAKILGQVLFTFCIRLGDAERRAEILALRGAEERLGHALLHFARTRGRSRAEQGFVDEVRLNLTHDELAVLTALSRQRVTITMNNFRARGFISYNRNQPLFVNTALLAEFLGVDRY